MYKKWLFKVKIERTPEYSGRHKKQNMF
jgi:hypothetical protein